ncbi:mitochondrial inner membrane protein Mpv17-like [Dermacentor albipictus]|uniref:mitochondrial inner membrane protein Mpv17-like n=1 Tax=Dermacentor albipictus TaxID=60249 RepID=UPI0038FCE080
MRQAWSFYARMVRDHPMKTQMITTATVMLSGDLIAQKVIERRPEVDVPRAARFFVMGVGFVCPVVRGWYLILERVVGSGAGTALVVKKVLLDQTIFGPLFVPSFMVVLGALQGRSWDDIKQSVRANYLQILGTMYMIWPVAQFVNFKFVPLSYRQPFGSSVAIVWNTYLASKANRTPRTGPGEVTSNFADLKACVPSTGS